MSPIWRACVEEAWAAYRTGSLPIGAVIADARGRIVTRGRNRISEAKPPEGLLGGNPLAHAEVNALLALHATDADPAACVLYTTTEPCPLCVGASYMSRVRDLRFAARDPWAGGAHLPAASPYLGRHGSWVAGPHAELETALVALQVEAHLRLWGERKEFLDSWRRVLPAGFALGERLAETGRLQELAEAGADARSVLEELSKASAAAA
jgi:tRNA(adenine34) deaminase